MCLCGRVVVWQIVSLGCNSQMSRPFSARSSCYISKMPQIALTLLILILDADDRPLDSDKLSLSHQSQSILIMRVDDDFVLGNPEEEDKYVKLKEIRVHPLCVLPPSNRPGRKATLYCWVHRFTLLCFLLIFRPPEDQDTWSIGLFKRGQHRSTIR